MATFRAGANEYEFFSSDRFTTSEWREAKLRTKLLPIEFQAAIGNLDPDCWVYQLEVSIKRGGGVVTGKEFDDVELVAFISAIFEQLQAEVAARPPAESSQSSTRSESASEPNGATGSGGETLSSETIPATSGA